MWTSGESETTFFFVLTQSLSSFAGLGPFISVFFRYETVDNNRKEKSCRMYIIVMKQIDSF